MSLANPTIAVIGAGAVGGYYGARLAQHGRDVHFLMRSDYAAVRRQGLTIRSSEGDLVLQPPVLHIYQDVRQMPKADLVLVALKATANDQYHPLIAPLLKEDTAILTLQNGLGNEEQLAELFGASRILGGLAFVCLNRISPGVIHHTDYGMIRLGELGGGHSTRAQQVASLFTASHIRCDVLDDLRYGRWEKLLWNIPFNGLGAALDLTTDQILATREGEQWVRTIMAEVIAIAQAVGVLLPQSLIDQKVAQTRTMGAYRSSMQIDRQEGLPLEVEAILGRPLEAAHRTKVPAPELETLYRLVRLVNLGKI